MSKDNIGPAGQSTPDLDGLIARNRGLQPPPPSARFPRLGVDEVMQSVRTEVAKRRGRELLSHSDVQPSRSAGSDESGFANAVGPWRSVHRLHVGKGEYALNDLIVGSDQTFVETAYHALLRRAPDSEGRDFYLGQLRSGALSKIEILGALRWSPEGLARSVHVDGLMVPYKLRRWQRKRVIGPIIRWIHALVRLGSIPERQQMADVAAAHEAHGLGTALNELAREVDVRFARLEATVSQQVNAIDGKLAAFPLDLDQVQASLQLRLEAMAAELAKTARKDELDRRISETQSANRKDLGAAQQTVAKLGSSVERMSSAHGGFLDRLAAMQSHLETLKPFPAALVVTQQAIDKLAQRQAETNAALKATEGLKSEIQQLQQQLGSALEQIQTALEAGTRQRAQQEALLSRHEAELGDQKASLHGHGATLSQMEQAKASEKEDARALDPLYVAFEDRFRGDANLVRSRAEPYVQLVVGAGAGSATSPVLDLGCGRGEWLELLRDHGLVGRGIDSNRIFVELCRGRGLDVLEGDVIEIMRALPNGSVGAITGMHIAEHLEFDVLVRLLDEARRLLVPGGLLALETPNPENLRVATQLFYMDPTHRNPLPPEAFRWLVEARGFDQARIERWTIARDTGAPPLLDGTIPGAESVNVLLSQLAIAPDYSIIARRGAS